MNVTIVKNSNRQEADQLAIYKAWPRIWTRDYRETNPASGKVEALNPGPPNYNTSALNHSATLLPGICREKVHKVKTQPSYAYKSVLFSIHLSLLCWPRSSQTAKVWVQEQSSNMRPQEVMAYLLKATWRRFLLTILRFLYCGDMMNFAQCKYLGYSSHVSAQQI